MSILNPSIGTVLTSSTALLTSIAILITNKFISKLKLRYTELRDWINVNTLLYEKTSKQSMVDKEIIEKEAEELENIYSPYNDKRKDIMHSTKIKLEDFSDNVKSTDTISSEQMTK